MKKYLTWILVLICLIGIVNAEKGYDFYKDKKGEIKSLSTNDFKKLVEKDERFANDFIDDLTHEQLNSVSDKLNKESILKRRKDIEDISKLNKDFLDQAWKQEYPNVELSIIGNNVKWEDDVISSGQDKQDLSTLKSNLLSVAVVDGKIFLTTKENAEIEIQGNGITFDGNNYITLNSQVKVTGNTNIKVNGRNIKLIQGDVTIKGSSYDVKGKAEISNGELTFITNENAKINFNSNEKAKFGEVNINGLNIDSQVEGIVKLKKGEIHFEKENGRILTKISNKNLFLHNFKGQHIKVNSIEIFESGKVMLGNKQVVSPESKLKNMLESFRKKSLQRKKNWLRLNDDDLKDLAAMRGYNVDDTTPNDLVLEYALSVTKDKNIGVSNLDVRDYLKVKNTMLLQYSNLQHKVKEEAENTIARIATVSDDGGKVTKINYDGVDYEVKDDSVEIDEKIYRNVQSEDIRKRIAIGIAKSENLAEIGEQRAATKRQLSSLLSSSKNYVAEEDGIIGKDKKLVKLDDVMSFSSTLGYSDYDDVAKSADTVHSLGLDSEFYNKNKIIVDVASAFTADKTIQDKNKKLINLAFLSSYGNDNGVSFVLEDGTRVNYELNKETGEFTLTDSNDNKRDIRFKDSFIKSALKSTRGVVSYDVWQQSNSEMKKALVHTLMNTLAHSDEDNSVDLNFASEFKKGNIQTRLKGSKVVAFFKKEKASNEYGSLLRLNSDSPNVKNDETYRIMKARGLSYIGEDLTKQKSEPEVEEKVREYTPSNLQLFQKHKHDDFDLYVDDELLIENVKPQIAVAMHQVQDKEVKVVQQVSEVIAPMADISVKPKLKVNEKRVKEIIQSKEKVIEKSKGEREIKKDPEIVVPVIRGPKLGYTTFLSRITLPNTEKGLGRRLAFNLFAPGELVLINFKTENEQRRLIQKKFDAEINKVDPSWNKKYEKANIETLFGSEVEFLKSNKVGNGAIKITERSGKEGIIEDLNYNTMRRLRQLFT